MRLKKISATNLTCIRSRTIAIPDGAAVVLLAGPNGSGKSSLLEAIRYALTGEFPRGLQYKKDARQAVTRGERLGRISIDVDRDGTVSEYKISIATGEYGGDSAPPMGDGALTLAPQRFMELGAAERRRALFKRTGIDISGKGVTAKLEEAGHSPDLVAEVRTSFAGGFESGQRAAADLASEARAVWQSVTGETFGTVKAADWEAPAPAGLEDPAELKALLDDALADQLSTASQLQAIQADANVNRDREKHEAMAAELPELATEIERLEAAVRDQEQKIKDEESGRLPDGSWECACPKCGQLLLAQAGTLTASERSPRAAAGQQGLLAQMRKELTTVKDSLRQKRNRQEHALGSKQMLGQMPPAPDAEELEAARTAAQNAATEVELLRDRHEKAIRDGMLARTAKERTARARAQFDRFTAFTALAKAIEALPAAYLDEALVTINHAMDVVSSAFPQGVTLNEDMVLNYGETPYHLASKSEQWRMDLALGVALAHIDNGIVLMDEFDVLEPAARGPLLKLLPELGVQLVIGATLKQRPELPAPPFHVEWLGS